MSLHVCILGIDGSGKSTVVAALPALLAAETGLTVGAAGDSFGVVKPDEDHLAARFYPEGLPFTARLSLRLRTWAKKYADQPKIYTVLKLAHLLIKDSAAQKLAQRYSTGVFVSDGNALLSTTGRAANYLRAASSKDQSPGTPKVEDISAVFSYVLTDKPLPPENSERLPSLRKAKLICKLNNLLRLRAVWLPDVVIFLEIDPETALQRIRSRGKKIDRHENLADLAQAREMYLKTLRAVQLYRGDRNSAHCISVDHLTLGETLHAVVDVLRPHLLDEAALHRGSSSPLGTTDLADEVIRKKTLTGSYFLRYLLPKWFNGAWREPTFFFSKLGRLFLKEGYSAGVMRAIYDSDEKQQGLLDRVFLDYSLHRAVYNRLQLLVKKIKPELEARLANGGQVRIFTAPSGFAYDVFRPLEDIARCDPAAMKRVHLVAVDLDPHGILAEELSVRASRLGIDFTFQRGDLTDVQMRSRLEQLGPFDLALFVGLSSWLPKPQTLLHMAWLRKNLRDGGRLITDCFTPDAYALSGRYIGYKANYYTPEVYRAMLDYCGFDGLNVDQESGQNLINHVFVASFATVPATWVSKHSTSAPVLQ